MVTLLILRIRGLCLSKMLIGIRLRARIYRYEYAYIFVSTCVFSVYWKTRTCSKDSGLNKNYRTMKNCKSNLITKHINLEIKNTKIRIWPKGPYQIILMNTPSVLKCRAFWFILSQTVLYLTKFIEMSNNSLKVKWE